MVRQGRGAIVNMSSANAVVAIANQVPYVASKGAVNQLTKVMALALADKGVRVNAIGPGSILTDLLKVVMSDDAARRRILSRTPMGRCGEPSEVAKVALFLASDDASYLTGQVHLPRRRPPRAQLHRAGARLRGDPPDRAGSGALGASGRSGEPIVEPACPPESAPPRLAKAPAALTLSRCGAAPKQALTDLRAGSITAGIACRKRPEL